MDFYDSAVFESFVPSPEFLEQVSELWIKSRWQTRDGTSKFEYEGFRKVVPFMFGPGEPRYYRHKLIDDTI